MGRKLIIGGTSRLSGWEVLNAVPDTFVDHVCDARDVSIFGDDTFSKIYASHVIEHFDYKLELSRALQGWHRILLPGGKLYLSAPDIDTIASLLLQKDRFNIDERFILMRMMFGGHKDKYDYHLVGLNYEFIASYLHKSGFVKIRRVKGFGLLQDTSSMLFGEVPISVNVVAEKSSY